MMSSRKALAWHLETHRRCWFWISKNLNSIFSIMICPFQMMSSKKSCSVYNFTCHVSI